MRAALTVFTVSRAYMLIVLVLLQPHYLANAPEEAVFAQNPLWDPFILYDSAHYLRIAATGYTGTDLMAAAFFPLYPLLIRLPASLGLSLEAAGVLLSHLFFLAGLYCGKQLLRHYGYQGNGPLWLLAFFPASYFFSAIYTESLYLALLTAALLFYARGRWTGVLAAGALLAVTKVQGVAVLGIFLLVFWVRHRPGRPAVLASLFSLVPCLAFFTTEYLIYGSPFAFSQVQPLFWREFAWPWQVLAHDFITHPLNPVFAFNLLGLVLVGLALVQPGKLLWRAIILAHGSIPLFTAQVLPHLPDTHGYIRYILPVFPLYIALDTRLRPYPALYRIAFVLFLLMWLFFLQGIAQKLFLA